LGWTTSAIIVRPGPLAVYPDAPVAAEWRAAWQLGGSLPSVHTLVCAALAHTLVRTWPVLAVSAYPIALTAGVAAVFFGQAWSSDVLAGLVLGVLVAEFARWAAGAALSRRIRRVEPV
jgi:membrane-associated phospholipid phosphatase